MKTGVAREVARAGKVRAGDLVHAYASFVHQPGGRTDVLTYCHLLIADGEPATDPITCPDCDAVRRHVTSRDS